MKTKANSFWRRFKLAGLTGLFVVALVIIFYALLSREPDGAQAQKAMFYPDTCLGGWKNAKNASGVPDGLEDLEYSEKNSAIFSDGDSSIFCGEFKGELPPQTYQTRVTLRFSWKQETLLPTVVDEPSLIDVIVDIFDHEGEPGDTTSGEGVDAGENSTSTEETTSTSTEEIVTDQATTTIEEINTASSTETVVDTALSGDETPQEEVVVEEVIEEVVEEVIEEPTPQVEAEVEPSPEPAPEPEPISWWRVFANTVYAEELATTIEDEVNEITVATSTEEEIVDGSTTQDETVVSEVETLTESNDAIFAVEYTLDGETWNNIGYVTTIDNDVRFELPSEALVTIEDVNEIQIALRPLLRYDTLPPIYLDSMWFEISYAPVRELGVHALSSIVPEKVTFEEFFIKDAVLNASTTLIGMSIDEFLASTTLVHGIDSRYAMVQINYQGENELWLADMDQKSITRIGFAEAITGAYPVASKERMIFWLNYDASLLFTYDLRTGGSLHEMALVANLPSSDEQRFTFPFTDWQVVWRAEEFYFYKDTPGEVFKDEDTKSLDRLNSYLTNQKELEVLDGEAAIETATTTEEVIEETATTTDIES